MGRIGSLLFALAPAPKFAQASEEDTADGSCSTLEKALMMQVYLSIVATVRDLDPHSARIQYANVI